MPAVVWVLVAVAAVVLVAVVLARRNRSPHNSVDSFRRQIDALGPAARRTVVDQVQTAAGRDQDPADQDPTDEDTTDEPGGEDGPRGT